MLKKSILLILLFFNLISIANNSTEAIQKRIEPVGKVNVAADPAKQATPVSDKAIKPGEPKAAVQAQAADGKSIYDKYCVICHASGVAGAPKIGDKTAWKPRIAKGMAKLDENVMKGLNAMPPKGSCMDCTDAQLKAAVEYIVKQSS